jgi:predicted dienelactone hydrolase
MNSQLLNSHTSVVAIGAAIVTVGIQLPVAAQTFNPAPLFDRSNQYSVTIPRTDGGVDAADIYYPVLAASSQEKLPIALLFQGALVDKSEYANFASTVARYGFAVVVPNHSRTLFSPVTGPSTGFFPEQQQANDVLNYLAIENATPASSIAGQLDTNTLVLLGHSFGGAVGIATVQGDCVPILCTGSFDRPAVLKGAAFYGTSFFDPRFGGTVPPINNAGIPLALIAGSADSVTDLADVEATYAQIQVPPQALVKVLGANHYGITNVNNPIRDPNPPTLEQAVATETIARWSALFLRANVLNDPGAAEYVFGSGDALDPNVTVTAAVPEPSSVVGLLLFGVGFGWLKRRQNAA